MYVTRSADGTYGGVHCYVTYACHLIESSPKPLRSYSPSPAPGFFICRVNKLDNPSLLFTSFIFPIILCSAPVTDTDTV